MMPMVPSALLEACELIELPTSLRIIGVCVSSASFSEMLGVGNSPRDFLNDRRSSLEFVFL